MILALIKQELSQTRRMIQQLYAIYVAGVATLLFCRDILVIHIGFLFASEYQQNEQTKLNETRAACYSNTETRPYSKYYDANNAKGLEGAKRLT